MVIGYHLVSPLREQVFNDWNRVGHTKDDNTICGLDNRLSGRNNEFLSSNDGANEGIFWEFCFERDEFLVDDFGVDASDNLNNFRVYSVERGNRDYISTTDEPQDVANDCEMSTHCAIESRDTC